MFPITVSLLFIALYSSVGGQSVPLYELQPLEQEVFMNEAIKHCDTGLFSFMLKHYPDAVKGVDLSKSVFNWFREEFSNPMFLRILMAMGADMNSRNAVGETPLYLIMRHRPYRRVLTTELLHWGAEVNTVAGNGFTPLMKAIDNDSSFQVYMLLKAGADRTKMVSPNVTLVSWAIKRSKYVAPVLLGLKDETTYNYCADSNDLETRLTSFFLDYISNGTDSLLRTPLHKNCSSSFSTNEDKTIVNQQDLLKRTPLHTAVQRDDDRCVEMLLYAGADIEAVDWLNRTALQIARFCGYSHIEHILENHMHFMMNATTISTDIRVDSTETD